jgi:signal transduction histidine kinase
MLVKLQSISDLGGQELVYKEVFFKEIFEQVVNDYRDQVKEKGILITEQVELLSPIYSYPAMVKIIMENLVENAIFFARVGEPFIKLRVYTSGTSVIIEVEDNGEGIPQEYQSRVFEMYFRANERSKGNGLGLYIVAKAVERLQGTIVFTSELNIGTKFTLTFPERIIMTA